jgi:uncharacterized surface protein with fasciclin (FAS1) repeats
MKTRTQLLMGILGLSAFVSLPAIAQNNQVENSFNATPIETAQDTPSSPNRPAEERKTPSPSNNTAPASKNIVEQAASSNEFQTLAKAIKAAGLEQQLAGKGPYTVFAPTDKAFAALPKGVVDELLKPENKELLAQLLSYHVVPGAVTSTQIKPGEVKTLVGEPVTVKRSQDGTVTVNNAKVTQADIQASNGVIHAVDQVILPPDPEPRPEGVPSPTQPEAAPSPTQPEAKPAPNR